MRQDQPLMYLAHLGFADESPELCVVLGVGFHVLTDVLDLLPPVTCIHTCR